jgi:hypothetical protein
MLVRRRAVSAGEVGYAGTLPKIVVIRPIRLTSGRHRHQCQRRSVDVAGLRQAMVALEGQHGRLHVEAVDAILRHRRAIAAAIALLFQQGLQMPDALAGFADTQRAVVHDRQGLDALRPPLGVDRQSPAGEIGDVVFVLLVVAGVHFEMDVDGSGRHIVLRPEGLPVFDRVADAQRDIAHMPYAGDDLAAFAVENIHQPLIGIHPANVTGDRGWHIDIAHAAAT